MEQQEKQNNHSPFSNFSEQVNLCLHWETAEFDQVCKPFKTGVYLSPQQMERARYNWLGF
jgi:hypothetical protein